MKALTNNLKRVPKEDENEDDLSSVKVNFRTLALAELKVSKDALLELLEQASDLEAVDLTDISIDDEILKILEKRTLDDVRISGPQLSKDAHHVIS